jgi:hypothetical protein
LVAVVHRNEQITEALFARAFYEHRRPHAMPMDGGRDFHLTRREQQSIFRGVDLATVGSDFNRRRLPF